MKQEENNGLFYGYIKKEEKEYVCGNCGTYSMKSKEIDITNDHTAKVTLKCHRCEGQRDVTINYFGD